MPKRGPARDLGILIAQLAFVTVTAFADLERAAGQRNADPMAGDRFHGHPLTGR